MLKLLVYFQIILLLSSVFINGWYAITRGRWEVSPNGRKTWTGKIFNFLHKFLQQHTLRRENYTGERLLQEFAKISGMFTESQVISFSDDRITLNFHRTDLIRFKAAQAGMKIDLSHDQENIVLKIYTEEEEYKIPYLLRDPLGMCLTCMSSFYGVIMFLFWHTLTVKLNKLVPTDSITAYLEWNWIGAKGAVLIFFCICLAYLNDLLLGFKK